MHCCTEGGPISDKTRQRFETQGSLYIEAAKTLTGLPVKEMFFLSAQKGEVFLRLP